MLELCYKECAPSNNFQLRSSHSNIFPALRITVVSKCRQIRSPQKPLAIPVTVLVSREARSLEHLVTRDASSIFEFDKGYLSKHSTHFCVKSWSVSFRHLCCPVRQSESWWKCWARNTMLMTDMVRKLATLSRSKIFITRSFLLVMDLFFKKFRPQNKKKLHSIL